MKAIAPQATLAGRYVIEEHIATGGMSSVWRGRDQVLARTVAVKVLRDDLAERPDFRDRFHHEAVAAARLNHPAIISIFDTGIDDGVAFIVMEHFPGRTLAQVLADHGPLDAGRAISLMLPVLDALAYAHREGVIHRDIKPSNILVGPGDRVKVADFGIAKVMTGEDLTTTGKVLGTVRYLSPEQVSEGDVDGRSDLYSAGLVLYELVTGRPPFQGESEMATALLRLTADPIPPRSIVPGLPRDVEAAILRALARRADDRFSSAEAMRAALGRWAGADTVTERAPAADTREVDSAGGSTFRSWMLIPLVLVLVAGAAIAAGLALGGLELGGPLGIRADGGNGERLEAIQVAEASDVDPFGDDSENPGEAPLAVDGRPETVWSTEHYDSAAFGGLKDGLGLFLDVDGSPELTRITITSPRGGWTFQLLPGSNPDPNASPLRASDGTTTFTMPESGRLEIELRPARIPGLMIWITQLALDPDDGRFNAEVGDVTLAGPSQ
jgi:tRNA A-37 threonylcarbamoyl transferase component Bud32